MQRSASNPLKCKHNGGHWDKKGIDVWFKLSNAIKQDRSCHRDAFDDAMNRKMIEKYGSAEDNTRAKRKRPEEYELYWEEI